MTDDRTSFLDLPLPHEENFLDADVLRLRTALTSLDSAISSLTDDVTALAILVPSNLPDKLSGLSSDVSDLETTLMSVQSDVNTHGSAISALEGARGAANGICDLNASRLVPVERLPNLNASKITAGTFDVARLPGLDASNIGTGVFVVDRIPNLAASKITSGTLNAARIPALATSKITGLDAALDSKFNAAGGTISGAVSVTGNVSVTGQITASGDITAFSDERLKTKVTTLADALEKVRALRGVSFHMGGARRIGVIAQEVRRVVPEVVADGGEYLSVAYGNLVGLLIEAVKELAGRVDSLSDRV